MKDFRGLTIICNGCGDPMREMGEWPVQWPKADKPKNMQQSFRYYCSTCRLPNPQYKPGIPFGINILVDDDISGDIYKDK